MDLTSEAVAGLTSGLFSPGAEDDAVVEDVRAVAASSLLS